MNGIGDPSKLCPCIAHLRSVSGSRSGCPSSPPVRARGRATLRHRACPRHWARLGPAGQSRNWNRACRCPARTRVSAMRSSSAMLSPTISISLSMARLIRPSSLELPLTSSLSGRSPLQARNASRKGRRRRSDARLCRQAEHCRVRRCLAGITNLAFGIEPLEDLLIRDEICPDVRRIGDVQRQAELIYPPGERSASQDELVARYIDEGRYVGGSWSRRAGLSARRERGHGERNSSLAEKLPP
jgi:hypothetical protein